MQFLLTLLLVFVVPGYCTSSEGKKKLITLSLYHFSEQQLINYVNSQNSYWKAGIPSESRDSMLKTLIPNPETVNFRENEPISQQFSSKFDLAPSFDARERWPECSSISLINDVSECSKWSKIAEYLEKG